MSGHPWVAGAATGVGSLPGTDVVEAMRLVFDELPDLPHLPELPGRGPGADLIGRGAALLVDLAVDLQPSGWRLVDRPGRDVRRAWDMLARDLDTLEEVGEGYAGPIKVQAAGLWTLAGAVELHYGDKVVSDPGAVRDLGQSLAEGLRRHVADVARRLPAAQVVLQVDEPGLPAVLAGRVPTASGFGTLSAVEAVVVEAGLRDLLTATGAYPAVHCCAARPPLALFQAAGARALSMDVSQLRESDDEALGTAVEADVALWLGVVPSVAGSAGAPMSDVAGSVGSVQKLWRRLGFDPVRLPEGVVVTPACGLAGASPAYARAALRRSREVARALREDPEGSPVAVQRG
jgi:Cobalamin-independent synthase, Catalytic domain